VDQYDFSVTSRRNYLRTIKRCLTWAVRQGYLDRNPIAAIEVPAAEHREIVVSPAEYAGLLSVVQDEHLRDLIVVTWETGCRPQESLRVEGRHVDRVNKRWVFPRSESKNKKLSRVVYLTDTAFAITQRRLAASPTGPLFRNSLGRPWTTEAVNCGFGRIRARVGLRRLQEDGFELDEDEVQAFAGTLKVQRTEYGRTRNKSERELLGEARRKLLQRRASRMVPNYSLYALRHSWATHALERGVDALTVAVLMGHSDPSMLAKVYQHLSLNPEHLRSQLEKAVG
jgi:integrase